MTIIDVVLVEQSARRTMTPSLAWTRNARWRVETDNPMEDPVLIAAAPFNRPDQGAGWQTGWTEGNSFATYFAVDNPLHGPDGQTSNFTEDNEVFLTEVEARLETPPDTPDSGNRYFWSVTATYRDVDLLQSLGTKISNLKHPKGLPEGP